MCNLSDLVEKKGIEKGIANEKTERIQIMLQNGFAKEQILQAGYTEEEYRKAEEVIN